MMKEQDHRQAAADLKRAAAQVKSTVRDLRELDKMKVPADRRLGRLAIAADLGRLGFQFLGLVA